MSIVSPKSGRLIKIGSKAYSDLLKDPKYKDAIFTSSSENISKARVSPSGLPPLKNNLKTEESLSPVPVPIASPKIKLPSLHKSPSSPLPLKLPPLPLSPRFSKTTPVFSPPSPSNSLSKFPMPILPPLPVSSTPSSLPVLNIPVKVSPSLKLAGKMLPSLSPVNKLPVSPINKLPVSPVDDMEEILSMPFYDIPTLEETLKNTRQSSKRAKIEAMIKEKKYEEGRGIKTRGWSSRAPTRGKERHQLHSECGDKCFLLPESEKFPICASPRTTGGKSVCEIDCGGVLSAKIRAKQWGYEEVAKKAEKILEKCNRDGLEHFTPSQLTPAPRSPKLSPSAKLAGTMPRGGARRTSRRTSRRNIELSPSVYEYGSSKNEEKTPDCGCGN